MKFSYIRRFFYEIHLWLGILSGIVVLLVCLSGGIYAFREEVAMIAEPHKYFVKVPKSQDGVKPERMSADDLVKKIEELKSGQKVSSIRISDNPKRTVAITLTQSGGRNSGGFGGRGEGFGGGNFSGSGGGGGNFGRGRNEGRNRGENNNNPRQENSPSPESTENKTDPKIENTPAENKVENKTDSKVESVSVENKVESVSTENKVENKSETKVESVSTESTENVGESRPRRERNRDSSESGESRRRGRDENSERPAGQGQAQGQDRSRQGGQQGGRSGGGGGGGGMRGGNVIYVNPYTGEIVGEGSNQSLNRFFMSMMQLHRNLWIDSYFLRGDQSQRGGRLGGENNASRPTGEREGNIARGERGENNERGNRGEGFTRRERGERGNRGENFARGERGDRGDRSEGAAAGARVEGGERSGRSGGERGGVGGAGGGRSRELTLGRKVVAYGTLVFIVVSISGFVLWLPRNLSGFCSWKVWKAGLKIRVTKGFWAFIYDMHNTVGFYTLIPILILALTGLCWSFDWYRSGLSRVLGDEIFKQRRMRMNMAMIDPVDDSMQPLLIEEIIKRTDGYIPGVGEVIVNIPASRNGVMSVQKGRTGFFALSVKDSVQWDRYRGKLVPFKIPVSGVDPENVIEVDVNRFSDKKLGEQIAMSIRSLHFGDVTGLSSKLVFGLSCFLVSAFPITGIMIWIKKLRANYRKRKMDKAKKLNAKIKPETDQTPIVESA